MMSSEKSFHAIDSLYIVLVGALSAVPNAFCAIYYVGRLSPCRSKQRTFKREKIAFEYDLERIKIPKDINQSLFGSYKISHPRSIFGMERCLGLF